MKVLLSRFHVNVHAIGFCLLTQKLEPPHKTILFLVILSQDSFYVLLIKYMFSWYIMGCLFAFQYFNTKDLNQTVPFLFQIKRRKRQLTSTTCGHVFCDKCIRSAVQMQNKCPTCRKKLSLKQLHPIFL